MVHSVKKVALVDDHPVFRLGLAELLNEFDDIEICFEASNGLEALDKLKDIRPDIILMDLEMPLMNGIQTTELVKKMYPETKILMLTMHNREELVTELARLGCNGYLLKEYKIEIIADAIQRVFKHQFFFRDHFTKGLLKKITLSNMDKAVDKNDVLTEREKEIVQMVCDEFNNKEISEKLCISVRTVERHRENIMLKMGVKNTVGMVIYAMKNRLVK